ncbi:biotin--[acetyl-CoA-carboxylase] ligase [Pedobacter cryophilus]|uniref:Biotin--[acetyl-CoA-carboxylase] ligase n=1 Tax=Pedobacter cryophilus TaxID=2571271 RepID=A0A4U1C3D9_9SPHI|nr:biotin--[acetyl-CoA-carboxylase] ligase [Pedobacter cryophilus]TKC00366.1 biotin--[acetyl-CoA-carboxylase] ligase [Pedobacter cryophilus]
MQNNTNLALFVGHSLVKLHEIDSTNTYLKNLLSNSKPLIEGTVIMADHQYAGRGQNQNVWESEAGKNLTISIYLKPSFLAVNEQFDLNKAVSLGIIDCLNNVLGENCHIKWPNDIYFHDKKIGGILIENVTKGYNLKESVIGIGINVNQINFPNQLGRVSSISKVLHKDYKLEKLLAQICKNIESRYLQLKAGKKELLAHDYKNNLFRLNEQHYFEIENDVVLGTIKGVTTTGKLLLQVGKELKELDLKEVKFIFD